MSAFGECRRCGGHVIWGRTLRGKWMPVDPIPVTRDEAGDRLLFSKRSMRHGREMQFRLVSDDPRRDEQWGYVRHECGNQVVIDPAAHCACCMKVLTRDDSPVWRPYCSSQCEQWGRQQTEAIA